MKRIAVAAVLVPLFSAASLQAAGSFPAPAICDRDCWNARPPSSTAGQMSSLTRAVIHHTAISGDWDTTSEEDSKANVRAIQNYHMDVNGWSDIGYHFLADKLGNAFEGREGAIDSWPRGAHDGVNDASFGFSMMGYFHDPYNQEPTLDIRCTVYDLIAWKIPDPFNGYGSSTYGGATVGKVAGHRDVKSTACPGDLMYNPYIGTDYTTGEARDEVNARIVDGAGLVCEGGPQCCPVPPILDGVFTASNGAVTVRWGDLGEVQAYRVYVEILGGTNPREEVREVPTGVTSYTDTGLVVGETRIYRVSAVGTLTESEPSDGYAARRPNGDAAHLLVIDGDDRWASQAENDGGGNHDFAASAGLAVDDRIGLDTVDNAALEGGRVDLADYDAVIWVLGEESTATETFSQTEQALVWPWLEAGGKLFVSGAEIGWDLVARGSTPDQSFFNGYLRGAYVADDAAQYDASPEAGGIFDGLPTITFSPDVRDVDYPDIIAPGSGARAELYYTRTTAGDSKDAFAAVSYTGAWQVVMMAFPFEAINDAALRSQMMERVISHFGLTPVDPVGEPVHVSSVRLGQVGKGRVRATAAVTIVDGDGAPVVGATVSGRFSGDVTPAVTATTNRMGVATLTTEPVRSTGLTFSFCVTGVEGTDLLYRPEDNLTTCASFGPTP